MWSEIANVYFLLALFASLIGCNVLVVGVFLFSSFVQVVYRVRDREGLFSPVYWGIPL